MSPIMPTYFIPHGGGPCFFMDWSTTGEPADTWDATAAWLRSLAADLPAAPAAILVVSAHWETPVLAAASVARPGMIYDYYGFPAHTYELQYPAPGSPGLAAQAVDLLRAAGFEAETDGSRGFDHGVFVPFLLAFPEATVPVVPLSLQRGLDPGLHLAAGRALAPLRRQGVLIIGSGMSYHNMRGFRTAAGTRHAGIFDRWLTGAVTEPDATRRWERLAGWVSAPSARDAHPREEHLLPLMVAAGAAEADAGRLVFTDTVMATRISGYRFG